MSDSGKKCTWQINWNDAIIESALRLTTDFFARWSRTIGPAQDAEIPDLMKFWRSGPTGPTIFVNSVLQLRSKSKDWKEGCSTSETYLKCHNTSSWKTVFLKRPHFSSRFHSTVLKIEEILAFPKKLGSKPSF